MYIGATSKNITTFKQYKMKTLKRFFKTIILSVIVFTLFYLMGSFVELTFNIFDWSKC